MTIVADRVDAAVGVDTHTDTHTAALVSSLGAVLAQVTVGADAAGHAQLLCWAAEHAPGPVVIWAVEGTRSHGIGLARALATAGAQVAQAPSPENSRRRRGGKSDGLDAIAAARAVLAAVHVRDPRADGDREALRILLACRRHDTDTRTATVNLFKSLILTADEALRAQLRGLSTRRQVRLVTDTGLPAGDTTEARIRGQQLQALAGRIRELDVALAANKRQLSALVTTVMPSLLALPGVGPVTAATLLITWSHRGRIRSEAAFAKLAGVNPVPASSGRTTRHRLNYGGDRTLNAALYTIALTRRRYHAPTIDYVARRRAEGKNDREITRCLKRYIARQLFRHMESAVTP
jgi:transposase